MGKRQEDAWLRKSYAQWYPFAPRTANRLARWAEHVRSLDVTVRPGGRAEVRHRSHFVTYRGKEEDHAPRWQVSIRWGYEPRSGYFIKGFKVDSGDDHHLPETNIDMAPYICALYLALGAEPLKPSGGDPPAPGKPASLGFYRDLIGEYEQLLREGHPSPNREQAKRRKVPEGTVKSWRSRGKRYLGHKEGEES